MKNAIDLPPLSSAAGSSVPPKGPGANRATSAGGGREKSTRTATTRTRVSGRVDVSSEQILPGLEIVTTNASRRIVKTTLVGAAVSVEFDTVKEETVDMVADPTIYDVGTPRIF